MSTTPASNVDAPATDGIEVAPPANSVPTTATENASPAVALTPEAVADALPSLTPAQIEQVLATVKRRVKVDGEERELSVADLEKDYQKREASDKRFREASELRSKLTEYLVAAKQNPRAIFDFLAKEGGHDPRQVAEDLLAEELQREMMSPEERELSATRTQLQQLQQQIASEKATAEQAERTKREGAEQQSLEADINKALVGSKLPRTEGMLQSMRDTLAIARREGYPLSASEVVDIARENYQRQVVQFLQEAPAETMAAFLGEDGLKKLRQYDMGRVKTPAPAVAASDQPPKKSTGEPQRASSRDFLSKLRGG